MHKDGFQRFRRSQIAELRPFDVNEDLPESISISAEDEKAGSPKLGDMIARNPANHNDQWLVAADYFAANFEPLASDDATPVISEETSARVASKAAIILGMKEFNASSDVPAADYNDLLHDAKIVAGSALTQAPDKPLDFRGRLVKERDDVDARLIRLNAYLADGAHDASPRHREMLREQSKCMSDLLAVLDERIADLHIDDRSAASTEISDGE